MDVGGIEDASTDRIGITIGVKLFPWADSRDMIVIMNIKPKRHYGGIIGSIVRKLIKLGRDDETIGELIEHYPFDESKYTLPDIFLTLIIITLADARTYLAKYILDKSCSYCGLRCNNKYVIEFKRLEHKNINDNIAVIEFAREAGLFSSLGYWGKIRHDEEVFLHYILRIKDDTLAKWATDKIQIHAVFDEGYKFTPEDLDFICKHEKLFNQKYIQDPRMSDNVIDMIMKKAIREKNSDIIEWYVHKRLNAKI
jgi:hypothetical protein